MAERFRSAQNYFFFWRLFRMSANYDDPFDSCPSTTKAEMFRKKIKRDKTHLSSNSSSTVNSGASRIDPSNTSYLEFGCSSIPVDKSPQYRIEISIDKNLRIQLGGILTSRSPTFTGTHLWCNRTKVESRRLPLPTPSFENCPDWIKPMLLSEFEVRENDFMIPEFVFAGSITVSFTRRDTQKPGSARSSRTSRTSSTRPCEPDGSR